MRIWPTPPLLLALGLLIGVSLPSSSELNAQTTASGALAGVVSDPSNAVIPDVDVEIQDHARATTQSTRTDRQGEYQFFFLAPGAYTLTAKHAGFREARRTVNVLLGPAVSVNITLKIAKATSEIAVTDEAPLIHAENGDASATVSQKQISEIPNPGNDLTYIVQTTPGVVMNTDVPNSTGMNFSILGAMRIAPISHVAPAREMSMMIGVYLGTRFLNEGHLARRLSGSGLIVAGVAALASG